ncbi:unnamed protein product [Miscanthus lutarioriparius]|uniref:PIN-like protein n=1 Tax=Miscanthus lutarioriparius TaxID=422564 RepID=A0A811PQX4_9POAL|nr:unnamed protein product [Miscanthus lutarioriparius]
MNLCFLVADTLQKLAVLFLLFLTSRLSSSHFLGFDWSITLFSLSMLPNTLVMGIPLLRGMYGGGAASSSSASTGLGALMVQYRAMRASLLDQFPRRCCRLHRLLRADSHRRLASARRDRASRPTPSHRRQRLLMARRHTGQKSGSPSRKSTSSRSEAACSPPTPTRSPCSPGSPTSPASRSTRYSRRRKRNPPQLSSFNHADFFNIVGAGAKGGGGAAAAGDEEKGAGGHSPQPQAVAMAAKRKDLHMLVWSSSAAVHVFGSGADDHADVLAKGNFFFQSPLALGVTILPLMNKNQQK